MSSPAAEGPDTETVVLKASRQPSSAPTWHSIKPDGVSSEFVDALERPLSEIDNMKPGSEKADSRTSKKPNKSDVSFTSTMEYGQTPFDQYTHQVKELCHLLWPPSPKVAQDVKTSRVGRLLANNRVPGVLLPKRSRSARASAPPKEFLIERLKGGGYNRIIGITIKHSIDEEPVRLILRVPRFDDARPDLELAVLKFIRHHTSIPVPEVKYFDLTSNNPLKKCYVIQNRIPGYDLQTDGTAPTCYPNLNHEQKCTFAKEFALLLLQLQDIMHPFPGLIEASANSDDDRSFTVRPFDLETCLGRAPEQDLTDKFPFFDVRPFVKDWKPSGKPPFDETTYYFMLAQFGRWKALELRCDPASIGWMKHYDRLVTMARQMDDLGLLGDDENCICHLDLLGAPRNIMADIKPDGSLRITGILDWDSAVFAPRFAGCAPPFWLWDSWDEEEEEEEEDGRHANDTPSDPGNREIKRIFEETIGSYFLHFAYKPEYRLARKLFQFAKCGIRASHELGEIEELVKEWDGIYESRMAAIKGEATDTENAATNAAEDEVNDSTETMASDG